MKHALNFYGTYCRSCQTSAASPQRPINYLQLHLTFSCVYKNGLKTPAFSPSVQQALLPSKSAKKPNFSQTGNSLVLVGN
jgi:hypothetical protein